MNIPTDLNKNEDIEELATKVRRYWNLGDGIIGNMLTLLEINGIIVSDANINKKGALSFSQKQTVMEIVDTLYLQVMIKISMYKKL